MSRYTRNDRYTENLNFEKQFPRNETFTNGTTFTSTSQEEKYQSNFASTRNQQKQSNKLKSFSSYRNNRSPSFKGTAFFQNDFNMASPITEVKPFILSPEASFGTKYEEETSSPIQKGKGHNFSLGFQRQTKQEKDYRIEDPTEDLEMIAESSCSSRPRTLASGWMTTNNNIERSSSGSLSSSADESTPSTSSSAAEDEEEERMRSHNNSRDDEEEEEEYQEGKESEQTRREEEEQTKKKKVRKAREREKEKEKEKEKQQEEAASERRREKRKQRKKKKSKRKPHAPAMPRPPPSPIMDELEESKTTEIQHEIPLTPAPIRPMYEDRRREEEVEEKEECKYSEETQESTANESKMDIQSFSTVRQRNNPEHSIALPKEKITMDMLDILRPFRSTQMVHCLLRRSTKGVMGKLNPTYTLYLQDEHWQTMGQIMTVKRNRKSRTPYYSFFDMTKGSIGKQFSKKSGNYLGKLRSNYHGNECTLYGPEVVPSGHVAIRFCRNKQDIISKAQGNSDPRAMRVLLPLVEAGDKDGTPPVIGTNGDTMLQQLEDQANFEETEQLGLNATRRRRNPNEEKYNNGTNEYALLGNKLPVFSRGSYRLNFGGRVTLPSVKNFQLVKMSNVIEENMNVDVTKLDDVMMQFGKVGDDDFHLDFRAPMTAFQAMGIVLAQFNF